MSYNNTKAQEKANSKWYRYRKSTKRPHADYPGSLVEVDTVHFYQVLISIQFKQIMDQDLVRNSKMKSADSWQKDQLARNSFKNLENVISANILPCKNY